MDSDSLAAALTNRVSGKVCLKDDALTAASRDFGGVWERRPRVVVWPNNVDDVVAVVRTARETSSAVAVRGAGHSQGGQALSDGGIVLQTERLAGIEQFSETGRWVTAGAGMIWRDLVGAVIKHSLVPTVLTDHLGISLGGSLAVGGLGPGSFRYGAQIDSCLEAEVVLGTGEVARLSAAQHPRVFRHVLGGLGQFGIITKVRLQLRAVPRLICLRYLQYDAVASLLDDARTLMNCNAVHMLSGCAVPSSSSGQRASHQLTLIVATEMDQDVPREQRRFPDNLTFGAQWQEDTTMLDYLASLDTAFERFKRPAKRQDAHPWVEHFLPMAAAAEYVAAAIGNFPRDPLLLWPMRTASFQQPMLCLPATEEMVLVGILCSTHEADLANVLPRLKLVDRLGDALGGKRYLSGWLDFDATRWIQHFGEDRWREITALKHQCDPDHIFRLW